ncbi:MAG: hypothetical protein RL095_3004 [Verrucomicrobiota bacterium]|jgi:hypothetical protein
MTPEIRRQLMLAIILCLVLGALAPWIWKRQYVAPRVAELQAQLKAEELLAAAVDAAPAPSKEELEALRQRRDTLKRLLPAPAPLAPSDEISPEQALAGLLQKLKSDGIAIQSFATDEKIQTKLNVACDYQALVMLLRDFPNAAPGLALSALEVQGKSGSLNCELLLAPITTQPEKK